MKKRRQAAILGLVDRHAITSQEELRGRLESVGFSVTQATLSRDIRDLALVKQASDGAYHRPGGAVTPARPAEFLQHAIAEYLVSVDVAQQVVVVKTGIGQAGPLAIALDAAALEDVVGTVAGDDTIMVVCRDATRAARVAKHLEDLARRM